MMSYEEFTQREAALESAPQAEREAFYAEILEKETAKTDVRMMAYFRAALLHYREGDFRAAREILEPFVIDYQSYAYRPEIIACFNLMGVAAYCECAYALSRFYIREGLKIAREHKEVSRYSYEYNNLAVTYLAQRDYEKALDAIREAEQHLPQSDKEMHAYVYRNLAEISCHVGHLDEACAAWNLNMVDRELLQNAVLHKPAEQELAMTGRDPAPWMLDAADYITEMCCRRHPYEKGIPARKGVEF